MKKQPLPYHPIFYDSLRASDYSYSVAYNILLIERCDLIYLQLNMAHVFFRSSLGIEVLACLALGVWYYAAVMFAAWFCT